MISKRARSIDTSGIRKVFNLAAGMKNPVNLSIGQPTFDAPPEMKEAAKKAIDQGQSRYTVTQGIEPLRAAIRDRYGVKDGEDLDVVVTEGVSGGFTLAYMAMLDPGDEVLIPDPFFGMYRDVACLLNAVPVFYDTYPAFRPDPGVIENLITPRTRAIVLNNPGNPTGVALAEDEVLVLLEVARRHDLWVIYDEIYSFFSYDHAHIQALRRYNKTVVLNGMAKSHGIPGWRLGYAVGPREIIGEMIKMQQYTFICAPSLVQYAAVAGLQSDMSSYLQEYRTKRDFLYSSLKDVLQMAKPTGAFYCFPEAPGGSGQKFVERCIAANLLVIPGNVFSRRDTHFRISFSATTSDLERGVEIIKKLSAV
jgi:aspartate/methionine/tyrosine aminotransferase